MDKDWQSVEAVLSKDMTTVIPADLETKTQHCTLVSAVFHLNNKEARSELKVNYNNETLPFCSKPKLPNWRIIPLSLPKVYVSANCSENIWTVV